MSPAGIVACATISAAAMFVSPAAAFTCGASTAGLAFGAYDPLAPAPLTSTVTLRVTCSLQPSDPPGPRVVGSTVQLSAGTSGSFVARQLASGTNRMNYNVYTTNAYATVWGDGAGATGTRSTSMLLTPGNPTRFMDLTGYGRVNALQDVPAGSYADSLIVSVFF